MISSSESPLPYTDTKPVGHADFYLAINATFRFIINKLGIEGLRRYWDDLGKSYYAPVSERWRQGGLGAIANYWRALFQAEPGAEVEVTEETDAVRLDVKTCPAIRQLRLREREIVACYCQHCYFVSEAIAQPAGFTVRVSGGNGSCVQRFMRNATDMPPQNMEDVVSNS